jgi:hypothetical protein
MSLAPIVLFVYNRPDMVQKTLSCLKRNTLAAQSEMFIFSDGPKENASPEQLHKIKQTREVIKREKWCEKVHIIEREKNKGLANSVIEGVSEVVNKYGKVIVIEDDVELSSLFLNYMNDSLDAYESIEQILAIGSWNYFASNHNFREDHFLFRYPDSIAWATYKRSWDLFEKDAKTAYRKLKKQKKINAFNGDGNAMYFENMLQMQIEQKINSWAIRWTATAIIHNKLTVLPKQTMSKHLGFGIEATHEKSEVDYNSHLVVSDKKLNVFSLNDIKENKYALSKWVAFVKANFVTEIEPEQTFYFRLKRKIGGILNKYVKKNL